jgi:hypothetical protein
MRYYKKEKILERHSMRGRSMSGQSVEQNPHVNQKPNLLRTYVMRLWPLAIGFTIAYLIVWGWQAFLLRKKI